MPLVERVNAIFHSAYITGSKNEVGYKRVCRTRPQKNASSKFLPKKKMLFFLFSLIKVCGCVRYLESKIHTTGRYRTTRPLDCCRAAVLGAPQDDRSSSPRASCQLHRSSSLRRSQALALSTLCLWERPHNLRLKRK